MGDWNITVVNQTGNGRLAPVNVNFVMFQIPIVQLEDDFWTNAWKVAKVEYPHSVGPIVLPTEVQFYVVDKAFGKPRKTGPSDVKFGQTYSVAQKDEDEAPTVTLTSEVAPELPEGQIKVINESGNVKPLEMALFKDDKPLLSFKNLLPGMAVFLSVEPAIFIADVQDGSIKEVDDFKPVFEAAKATAKFRLYPTKTEIIILIEQSSNGKIRFLESS